MRRHIAPIACKPWALSGLSERLIVSHYEQAYGTAVRFLNAIRDELNAIDLAAVPGYRIRALKQEELAAAGSVALHELYFGSLGGDGAVFSPAPARARRSQRLWRPRWSRSSAALSPGGESSSPSPRPSGAVPAGSF